MNGLSDGRVDNSRLNELIANRSHFDILAQSQSLFESEVTIGVRNFDLIENDDGIDAVLFFSELVSIGVEKKCIIQSFLIGAIDCSIEGEEGIVCTSCHRLHFDEGTGAGSSHSAIDKIIEFKKLAATRYKIEAKNGEIKQRYGYDVASYSGLLGMEIQGATTLFVANIKRILRLKAE